MTSLRELPCHVVLLLRALDCTYCHLSANGIAMAKSKAKTLEKNRKIIGEYCSQLLWIGVYNTLYVISGKISRHLHVPG